MTEPTGSNPSEGKEREERLIKVVERDKRRYRSILAFYVSLLAISVAAGIWSWQSGESELKTVKKQAQTLEDRLKSLEDQQQTLTDKLNTGAQALGKLEEQQKKVVKTVDEGALNAKDAAADAVVKANAEQKLADANAKGEFGKAAQSSEASIPETLGWLLAAFETKNQNPERKGAIEGWNVKGPSGVALKNIEDFKVGLKVQPLVPMNMRPRAPVQKEAENFTWDYAPRIGLARQGRDVQIKEVREVPSKTNIQVWIGVPLFSN